MSERFSLVLPSLDATARLAADLASLLKPGDVVALSGGLGSGKSTLARMILRALAEDPALEAPSPTFTLVQEYPTPRGAALHADLYRIADPDELVEMGLLEEMDGRIALIEWPERAGGALPEAERLDVTLAIDPALPPNARRVELSGGVAWHPRLGLTLGARRLIDQAGWSDARREHLQGDASSRAYERLVKPDGDTAILMISPPRPDGPAVRAGKPYSAIAKLAETVHAFVALAKGLKALGFSAPEIIAHDLATGLLIIEDFGAIPVTDENGPIAGRYAAAAELLAELHSHRLPAILPVAEGRDHVIPDYDRGALEIEIELLLDWYAPHLAGASLPAVARRQFMRLWEPFIEEATQGARTWVLRDYHSPNLIWLPGREGLKRVGLLDFQDAVLGSPAYDLASLAQDARIDVPPALEMRLIAAYAAARRAKDPEFDLPGFARAYAILGAQRATKILGIFARLDKRDGKPAYLRHVPRVAAYLRRNLAHPALAELRGWHLAHLPKLMAEPEAGTGP